MHWVPTRTPLTVHRRPSCHRPRRISTVDTGSHYHTLQQLTTATTTITTTITHDNDLHTTTTTKCTIDSSTNTRHRYRCRNCTSPPPHTRRRFADKGRSVARSPDAAASFSSSPSKKKTADAQGIASSSIVLDGTDKDHVHNINNNASVERGAVSTGNGAAVVRDAAGGDASVAGAVAAAKAGDAGGEAAESKEILVTVSTLS